MRFTNLLFQGERAGLYQVAISSLKLIDPVPQNWQGDHSHTMVSLKGEVGVKRGL